MGIQHVADFRRRGDLLNEFIEITEDEANQLMEQLRARWTGASSG